MHLLRSEEPTQRTPIGVLFALAGALTLRSVVEIGSHFHKYFVGAFCERPRANAVRSYGWRVRESSPTISSQIGFLQSTSDFKNFINFKKNIDKGRLLGYNNMKIKGSSLHRAYGRWRLVRQNGLYSKIRITVDRGLKRDFYHRLCDKGLFFCLDADKSQKMKGKRHGNSLQRCSGAFPA